MPATPGLTGSPRVRLFLRATGLLRGNALTTSGHLVRVVESWKPRFVGQGCERNYVNEPHEPLGQTAG
jgi:hypothetical protein